jgi:hypothetical protein
MSKRDNPAYAQFYANLDREPCDAEAYNARYVSEKAVVDGAIRRRIEDIQEGLRLEREAFDEVWHELER